MVNGQLVRGSLTSAAVAASLNMDTATATGTIQLKGLNFGTGGFDAVTMGAGSVGIYRAVRTGLTVDLFLGFLIGTSPNLGTAPLCVNSADLPARYRPRMPGSTVDAVGQTECKSIAALNNPTLTPDTTSPPACFFGWANLVALGGACATTPAGLLTSLATAAATTRLLSGVDATVNAFVTATNPIALPATATIELWVHYEAA